MFFKRKVAFDKDDISSIITACTAQDRGAQHALVEMYLAYAKSICKIYAKDQQDVEEMLNDGFLKVFNNIAKYDHTRPFKSWLRAIFVNTGIDHFRKNKRLDYSIALNDDINETIDPEILDYIDAEKLLDLIQKLPPTYRMVFTLYVVEGYNHKEIGDRLGIAEGTSKSNLRDARNKLQKMLTSLYGKQINDLKSTYL